MLIFPIGQESDKVRRVPWATLVIIGLCIIVHIFNFGAISRADDELVGIYQEIFEYYLTHPYLELDEEFKKDFFIPEELEELLETYNQSNSEPDEYEIEEEQEQLDLLVEHLKKAKKDHPHYKWGYIPNNKTFFGLIAHMFAHAGWMHLLGNLLYLYVMGPFIEDTWGRPAYILFYLVTGMLTAQAFSLHYPTSGVPMIGASGAISAVMGGFLVRHWHAKIRYFYWLWFGFWFRFGTFSAPAWLMLPVGFLMDFINAKIMDSVAAGGSGVAHWAHVWGFIFGMAGAFVIKFLKIEQKFVAPKVEAQTTYVNKSHVSYEEAMKMLDSGDKDQAYAMLWDTAKEDPTNKEVIETLWNLSQDMGRTGEVAPLLTRLVEKEVQQDEMDLALFHFNHLRDKVPDVRISVQTKIILFEQAVNAKDAKMAKSLFSEITNEINLMSPPGLLLNFCNAVMKFDLNFDQSNAPQVIELAMQHPDIPEERKESLKKQLYETPKQSVDAPIKVNSQYNEDFSQLSDPHAISIGDIDNTSSSSSFIVPPVPVAPTTPKSSTGTLKPPVPESGLQITSNEHEIPVITQDSKITPAQQEPLKPETPTYSQPPPIPREPTIPTIPHESEMSPITPDSTITLPPQEPTIPITPTAAQPPPFSQDTPIPVKPEKPVISMNPGSPPADMYSPPPPPLPRKSLRVTKAVPLGVKEGKIVLNVENVGKRIFILEKIKAIAVVKISPPGERPFLLIDLLVDDPTAPTDLTTQQGIIRSLRLLSTTFNPKKFVPQAQSPLEAFKTFTSALLKMSGANPLPNPDSVQLRKIAGFPSLQAYEESVLKTGHA